MNDHQFVFVTGLHRSGTSLLAKLIASHAMVSGFHDTGVPEDEGQHLQDVYPPASAYGGVGRFAFDARAHRTEASPLATPTAARQIFEQWSQHWDLSRPLLVEKSPPHLIATRFLQALFPKSSFVVILRHPAAVSLATKSRKQAADARLRLLLRHWFQAHELFASDAPKLQHLHVIRYENLVTDPAGELARVAAFLDIPNRFPPHELDAGVQVAYAQKWTTGSGISRRLAHAALGRQFHAQARRFGYSMADLEHVEPFLP